MWYVGYGSNLCRERFHCYIQGGEFSWGGSKAYGCTDKNHPLEDRPFSVPHRLYFAFPSSSWGGGVAFLDPKGSGTDFSHGRMWKITAEQYGEVREQEGRLLYDHEIHLGEEDGIPILTVTSGEVLNPCEKPSEAYLRTIALGLNETLGLSVDDVVEYLWGKEGIKGNYTRDGLKDILDSVF